MWFLFEEYTLCFMIPEANCLFFANSCLFVAEGKLSWLSSFLISFFKVDSVTSFQFVGTLYLCQISLGEPLKSSTLFQSIWQSRWTRCFENLSLSYIWKFLWFPNYPLLTLEWGRVWQNLGTWTKCSPKILKQLLLGFQIVIIYQIFITFKSHSMYKMSLHPNESHILNYFLTRKVILIR